MERLRFEERLVVKRPDVEGRFTKKGSFKETVKLLRMNGVPNDDGKYQKEPKRERKRREGERKPFQPHLRSTRSERREAQRNAEKAAKRSLRGSNGHSEPVISGQTV